MKQCSFFDVPDNYIRFINELFFILNHYKTTKAKYNQIQIADYILDIIRRHEIWNILLGVWLVLYWSIL